eukprot:gene14526-16083_t
MVESDQEPEYHESQDEGSSNEEDNNESEDDGVGDLKALNDGLPTCESSSVNTKETNEFNYDNKIELNLGTEQNSKEKRKERNKLLARKSRQKMKTELESLKVQLGVLMKENELLKQQMNSIHTPPVDVRQLVQNDIQLPDNIAQLIKQLMSKTEKTITPRKMKRSSFCIANAISVDVPIVYASPGFLKLTGYEMAEVLGRNCRFLQGPKTDQREVAKMKDAIIDGRDITVVLLNYRKDGKTFWNQIQLAHLKDQSGKTFLIVGIQTKVKLTGNQTSIPSISSTSEFPYNKAIIDGSLQTELQSTFSSSSRSNISSMGNSSSSSGPSSILLYPDMQYYYPTDAGLGNIPPPALATSIPTHYINKPVFPHMNGNMPMHPLNFPLPVAMNQFMQPLPRGYPLEYPPYQPARPTTTSSSDSNSPPVQTLPYTPTIMSAINSLNRNTGSSMSSPYTGPALPNYTPSTKPVTSISSNFPKNTNLSGFSPMYYDMAAKITSNGYILSESTAKQASKEKTSHSMQVNPSLPLHPPQNSSNNSSPSYSDFHSTSK